MADELTAPPGLEPLAEGREAEVFLRADGNVVKVMRLASQEDRVHREPPPSRPSPTASTWRPPSSRQPR